MDIATAPATAPATATSTPANQRIVVQATEFDKRAIVAKAKTLGIPISELMRRGAFAYQPDDTDDAMGALAEAAKASADRSAAAIDDALEFITLSNQRIAAMEAKTVKQAAKAIATSAQKSTRLARRKAVWRRT